MDRKYPAGSSSKRCLSSITARGEDLVFCAREAIARGTTMNDVLVLPLQARRFRLFVTGATTGW